MRLKTYFWGSRTQDVNKQLVFLHGLGGNGRLWRPIAAAMEDEYALLCPDQRGHGGSQLGQDGPLTYRPIDYGQDLIETLVEENFYPAFIVGHSMGVRSAVAAARLRPETCLGLVLVDLGFSGMAGGGMGHLLVSFWEGLPREFESRSLLRSYLQVHCPDPSIAQYLLAVSRSEPASQRVFFPFDQQALVETVRASEAQSMLTSLYELAEKKMPILALRGGESLVWRRDDFLREKKHFLSFPSVTFEEVPKATHALPFQKRLFFVERLKTWTAQV